METITVTKLDAARRQLATAIELWFRDGDPVSIHALAYASHEIIHRLYRNAGHKDLIYDSRIIKDEHRAEYAIAMKKAGNFFKHAKQDENDVLDFNPYINTIFLMMSIYAIKKTTGNINDTEHALLKWFAIKQPHWFTDSAFKEGADPERIEQVKRLSKSEFFEAFLSLLRQK